MELCTLFMGESGSMIPTAEYVLNGLIESLEFVGMLPEHKYLELPNNESAYLGEGWLVKCKFK